MQVNPVIYMRPIHGGIIKLIYQQLIPLSILMSVNQAKVIPAGFGFVLSFIASTIGGK